MAPGEVSRIKGRENPYRRDNGLRRGKLKDPEREPDTMHYKIFLILQYFVRSVLENLNIHEGPGSAEREKR